MEHLHTFHTIYKYIYIYIHIILIYLGHHNVLCCHWNINHGNGTIDNCITLPLISLLLEGCQSNIRTTQFCHSSFSSADLAFLSLSRRFVRWLFSVSNSSTRFMASLAWKVIHHFYKDRIILRIISTQIPIYLFKYNNAFIYKEWNNWFLIKIFFVPF